MIPFYMDRRDHIDEQIKRIKNGDEPSVDEDQDLYFLEQTRKDVEENLKIETDEVQ